MEKITANTILKALWTKHIEDVFISECKVGPSRHRGCPRLDAWAMKKSWASPLTTGYEIKVSRSDFLNDTKWASYLLYCNELYFVCPAKIILVEEVPEQCGLMYISSTGTRLYIKKKAPYRDVDIPVELYIYILMGRVRIVGEYQKADAVEYWKGWLKDKKEDQELGYRVSEKVRKKVDSVERINRSLTEKMEDYDDIRQLILDLGLDLNKTYLKYSVEKRVKEILTGIPDNLTRALTSLKRGISDFESVIQRIKDKEGIE